MIFFTGALPSLIKNILSLFFRWNGMTRVYKNSNVFYIIILFVLPYKIGKQQNFEKRNTINIYSLPPPPHLLAPCTIKWTVPIISSETPLKKCLPFNLIKFIM